MQRTVTIYTDIAYPMDVIQLPGTFFEGDDNAVNLRVRVTSNGQDTALSNTVSAYIIRADGDTLTVSGVADGESELQVALPAAAFAVCGPVQITIKLTSANGQTVTTLACCRCYVQRTGTQGQASAAAPWQSVAATAEGAWSAAVAGALAGAGEIMISVVRGNSGNQLVLYIPILAKDLAAEPRKFTSASLRSMTAGAEYRYRAEAAASLTEITLQAHSALSGEGDYGLENDVSSGYTWTYYYR